LAQIANATQQKRANFLEIAAKAGYRKRKRIAMTTNPFVLIVLKIVRKMFSLISAKGGVAKGRTKRLLPT